MQCLKQFFEKNKIYFSKISLIINLTLLIENLSIIFNNSYLYKLIKITIKHTNKFIILFNLFFIIYIFRYYSRIFQQKEYFI